MIIVTSWPVNLPELQSALSCAIINVIIASLMESNHIILWFGNVSNMIKKTYMELIQTLNKLLEQNYENLSIKIQLWELMIVRTLFMRRQGRLIQMTLWSIICHFVNNTRDNEPWTMRRNEIMKCIYYLVSKYKTMRDLLLLFCVMRSRWSPIY